MRRSWISDSEHPTVCTGYMSPCMSVWVPALWSFMCHSERWRAPLLPRPQSVCPGRSLYDMGHPPNLIRYLIPYSGQGPLDLCNSRSWFSNMPFTDSHWFLVEIKIKICMFHLSLHICPVYSLCIPGTRGLKMMADKCTSSYPATLPWNV